MSWEKAVGDKVTKLRSRWGKGIFGTYSHRIDPALIISKGSSGMDNRDEP